MVSHVAAVQKQLAAFAIDCDETMVWRGIRAIILRTRVASS